MGRKRKRGKARPGAGPARTTPEWRRWWTWVSLAMIPVLITIGGALYAANLSLDQAGEQEARAQDGANEAADQRLAEGPAVTTRVRPLVRGLSTWVFPDVVDEDTLRTAYDKANAETRTDFRALGAVECESIDVRVDDDPRSTVGFHVTLVGNRRDRIRVVDIRAKVVERTAPLDGTVLREAPQGASDTESVVVDLDDPNGVVKYLHTDRATGEKALRPLVDVRSLVLVEGESIALEVWSLTKAHRYLWRLEVTVDYGTVTGETVVIGADGTSDGRPFETTAWSERFRYRGGFYRLLPADGGKLSWDRLDPP